MSGGSIQIDFLTQFQNSLQRSALILSPFSSPEANSSADYDNTLSLQQETAPKWGQPVLDFVERASAKKGPKNSPRCSYTHHRRGNRSARRTKQRPHKWAKRARTTRLGFEWHEARTHALSYLNRVLSERNVLTTASSVAQDAHLRGLIQRYLIETSEQSLNIVDFGAFIRNVALWKASLPEVGAEFNPSLNEDLGLISMALVLGIPLRMSHITSLCKVMSVTNGQHMENAPLPRDCAPCKTPAHIASAVSAGVYSFTVDSIEEVERIAEQIALQCRDPTEVDIMVSISAEQIMASSDVLSEIVDLIEFALDNSFEVIGLSVDFSSLTKDLVEVRLCHEALESVLTETLSKSNEIISYIEARGVESKNEPVVLDIHGLPWHDIFRTHTPASGKKKFSIQNPYLVSIRRVVHKTLGSRLMVWKNTSKGACQWMPYKTNPNKSTNQTVGFRGVRLITDASTVVLRQTTSLITRVNGVRSMGLEGELGLRYYVADGVYGSFTDNALFNKRNSPKVIRMATASSQSESVSSASCTVYGPTCDSLDCIDKKMTLPLDLTAGDFLCFTNLVDNAFVKKTCFNGIGCPKVAYMVTGCKRNLVSFNDCANAYSNPMTAMPEDGQSSSDEQSDSAPVPLL